MYESQIKIGTKVKYYPLCNRDGSFDGQNFKETVITSEPWRLGHGDLVCKVEGVSGGVSISHLEKIKS